MKEKIRLALVGSGRIGYYHGMHIQEIAEEDKSCELLAVVDPDKASADKLVNDLRKRNHRVRYFASDKDLAQSGLCNGAVIASSTDAHYENASTLIHNGYKVLLEKPLADSLDRAKAFVKEIDSMQSGQTALMQAFQRRFDKALLYAKKQIIAGKIGKPFRITSSLEDPEPPPAGYNSPGLIIDMAVHNADEIMWLFDANPTSIASQGANLYNHSISPVKEDFDDCSVQLWFGEKSGSELMGRIQISRNHVSGYKNETEILGDKGKIVIDHFTGNPFEVSVNVISGNGYSKMRTFPLRNYPSDAPVFMQRFGEAYKEEIRHFIANFHNKEPFKVNHIDAYNAMVVVYAGFKAINAGKQPLTGFIEKIAE